MQRAIKGQEQLAYVGAADGYAAQPGQSITTMMRLALEGFDLSIRQRAAEWLWRTVGVKVVDEGEDHATASKAKDVRR